MEVSDLLHRIVQYNFDPNISTQVGMKSDSMLNDYVPFYSAFFAEFKRVEGKKFNIYSLPSRTCSYSTTPMNTSRSFVTAMRGYMQYLKFRKGEQVYNIVKGMIFQYHDGNEEADLLYCLAIKSDYLFGDEPLSLANLDHSKLVMLVKKNFVENPDMRLMYNFVKREVITPLSEVGIDIIYTNDVSRWCFKNPLRDLRFPTISQQRTYLNDLLNNTIDELTGRERPRELPQPVEEPAREELGTGTGEEIQRELDEGDNVTISPAFGEREAIIQSTGLPTEAFRTPGTGNSTFSVRLDENWANTNSIFTGPTTEEVGYSAGVEPVNTIVNYDTIRSGTPQHGEWWPGGSVQIRSGEGPASTSERDQIRIIHDDSGLDNHVSGVHRARTQPLTPDEAFANRWEPVSPPSPRGEPDFIFPDGRTTEQESEEEDEEEGETGDPAYNGDRY